MMTRKVLLFLFAMTLCLVLTPSSAFAKDHEDAHGRGKHFDRRHDRDSGRPPGWDRGKKTGWGGGAEPPGLAKKHQHDFDRDHDGYRDRHVRQTAHRRQHTYRRPTTTTTTTTTRRYPSPIVTGKRGTSQTTTTSTVRRPSDFNDHR